LAQAGFFAIHLIGLAAGGEAGSRLAIALGMSVSPDTIIQRIRQIQYLLRQKLG
jgi:hypothetical protein